MKDPIRVLIVDDRQAARLTLRDILLGFDCVFLDAPDGTTALRLLSETEFDVTFLDLSLPDISGIEVLREARRLGISTGKVIIMTGLPEPKTMEEAKDLGVFRYLRKPLDWNEIRHTFSEATFSVPSPALKFELKEEKVKKEASSPSEARPRLLVLADNKPWLDTINQVLGKDFELTLTTQHQVAYELSRKNDFALVVLDMRLVEGVSGFDVLSRMRKAVPDLRATILTEHPDFESAVESSRRGALDYVSKKDLAALPQTVKRILSGKAFPVRVFLSYERTDKVRVEHVYDKLMKRGFLPWMDVKSIIAGKWAPQISWAIDRCDYFVFFFSRHSLHNLNRKGMLRREIKQALKRQEDLGDHHVFFIPARLEDCEKIEPLEEFQHIDLFKKDGFTKLLQAIFSNQRANV